MVAFVYSAKRSIKSGHSAGTEYTINVGVRRDDREPMVTGDQHKALDGSTVSVIYDSEFYQSITTIGIDSSTTPDLDDMREFLDSVSNGESFTIDGTAHILASLTKPYTETRAGRSAYKRFQFKARQL